MQNLSSARNFHLQTFWTRLNLREYLVHTPFTIMTRGYVTKMVKQEHVNMALIINE